METIDVILFINLEHRKDRLKNIMYQLIESPVAKRLSFLTNKIHRINAVYNQNGAAGCAASHVKALELALEKNWTRIVILEDDFSWKENTDYIISCLKEIDSTPITWDVILLTTNNKYLKIEKTVGNMQKIHSGRTTAGYIVSGSNNIIKLKDVFQKSYDNLIKGLNKREWAIDMQWLPLQITGNWYCFKGHIGKQIDGYSDIEKRNEGNRNIF